MALLGAVSPQPAPFAVDQAPFLTETTINTQTPDFYSRFASHSFHRHVHSASVTRLPDGGLIAVWFAGTREGAHDVNIYASRFDFATLSWGEEFKLISRQTTEQKMQREIRKLGNPVIALAPNNRLWMFYVSVSVGGWAGSAINVMHSDDAGQTWTPPKRLITSPFLNLSTLVRNPPVFHADGSIGLPIYHEFVGKFAEYLYLSPEGRIIDKFRISEGDHSLQPVVVPVGANKAATLLRNAGWGQGKLLASFTDDRGENWSELTSVDEVWNPNSAVAALNTSDGDVLVVLNDLQDGRFRLSLYRTDSTFANWQLLKVLDEAPVFHEQVPKPLFMQTTKEHIAIMAETNPWLGPKSHKLLSYMDARRCKGRETCDVKYEYPTLIRGSDGFYHIVYSWNNTLIKHVAFNDRWLDQL